MNTTPPMDESLRGRIRDLLRREVVPAVGCTEPVAVALAAANSATVLRTVSSAPVTSVTCRLSANIIKNAMGVGIPGTGMTGLPIAVALGTLFGNPCNSLEVLAGITPEQVEEAHRQLVEPGRIEVLLAKDTPEILYINVEVTDGTHTATTTIAGCHDNVTSCTLDGKAIEPGSSEAGAASNTDTGGVPELTLSGVWHYAMDTPVEELRPILEAQRLNDAASRFALKGGYGHEIGSTLLYGPHRAMFGPSPFARIMARTAAACDARMGGAPVPVMSNSGSGNQGIAATMPVVAYAQEIGTDTATLVRALTLSHLTAIYIKQSLGRLSALCGCIVASSGSAAAICYMMGGGYPQVAASIKNMVANLTGMICDGAKPSCALKLTSAVSTAILSAIMGAENRSVNANEGIIDNDVDRTIRNLTDLGREAMKQTDIMILDIMTNKHN